MGNRQEVFDKYKTNVTTGYTFFPYFFRFLDKTKANKALLNEAVASL